MLSLRQAEQLFLDFTQSTGSLPRNGRAPAFTAFRLRKQPTQRFSNLSSAAAPISHLFTPATKSSIGVLSPPLGRIFLSTKTLRQARQREIEPSRKARPFALLRILPDLRNYGWLRRSRGGGCRGLFFSRKRYWYQRINELAETHWFRDIHGTKSVDARDAEVGPIRPTMLVFAHLLDYLLRIA